MNERSIFMEALERDTSADRSSFLDEVCAGDTALRRRVEALLQSHEEAGRFMDKPAPERFAEALTEPETGSETVGQATAEMAEDDLACLALAPARQPGALGRLGHYEILDVIGRGGMGVVLRAFDETLRRVVAVKVLAAPLAADGTARKRFAREAQAAASVSHDHVVTVHAVEDGPPPYMVMQYVAGVSLQQRLDREGPLPLEDVVRIGTQIAQGLAAAHAQGLVHRDVKPANVLLEKGTGRVKITDFGMARAASDAGLTGTGVVTGTPQYMAPEQARGWPVDARTDLFSLGSVLYALCTGRPPFRAGGSLAILKRICEETPAPIRESNPDVPDWLVAIIDRLQAKKPAERFQSASEVADRLNERQAGPRPPAPLPVASPHRRRRVAAAVGVLLLLGGLAATEATHITHMRSWLLPRQAEPESHVRGDRQEDGVKAVAVVHAAAPVAVPAPLTKGPFVLMADRKEQGYETLAEAVTAAGGSGTIEVRGNGPFVCESIAIAPGRGLAIRAGAGCLPVFERGPEACRNGLPLLVSRAPLTLEGLELRQPAADERKGDRTLVVSRESILQAANCRFRGGVGAHQSPALLFRNCEVLAGGGYFSVSLRPGGRLVYENCLHRTRGSVFNLRENPNDTQGVSLQVARSTFVADYAPVWVDLKNPQADAADLPDGMKRIRLEFSECVFDSATMLGARQSEGNAIEAEAAETELRRSLGWQGERNLFASGITRVKWHVVDQALTLNEAADLDGWKKLWATAEIDSQEGPLRFVGGNLRDRPGADLDRLTSEDFRLRPDSAGHRAASDGKDLGAEVDLVGPGPAYERWRKSSAYQQWLRETAQAPSGAAEPKAFVVLTSKGAEVRRYDTLAEAVQGSASGDTVEVRGNGPFLMAPLQIKAALTIRAGEGFWPVLQAAPDEPGKFLFHALAPLALEGLELRWLEAKAFDASTGSCRLVTAWGPMARLDLVNCRLLMNRNENRQTGMGCLGFWDAARCRLRNCQFQVAGHGTVSGHGLNLRPKPQGEVEMDNCLFVGQGVQLVLVHTEPMKLVLRRNTFLGANRSPLAFMLTKRLAPPPAGKDPRPLQIAASANLVEGYVQFSQFWPLLQKEMALDAGEVEQFLGRLVGWKEERNFYALPEDEDLFRIMLEPSPGKFAPLPLAAPIQSVADWERYWGMTGTDSRRGTARLRGGDVMERARQTPEQVLPADLRLTLNSDGCRAGKDGTDLGADVSLVGPGPAYERWKTTPAYQQWLKESGSP